MQQKKADKKRLIRLANPSSPAAGKHTRPPDLPRTSLIDYPGESRGFQEMDRIFPLRSRRKKVARETAAVVRKPFPHEEEDIVELSLALFQFNSMHAEKPGNLDRVLRARAVRIRSLFRAGDPNLLILLVTVTGRPAGYAIARIHQPDPARDGEMVLAGIIEELYLKEEARGLGIGKQIMAEVTEWMRTKGVKRVKLQIQVWNDVARKMYDKEGFSIYAVSCQKDL